ncbi:hypothetical protein J7I94_19665 [Streptomyces sp. ISL-12]|uniref:hypothetical protein n=1 Tax=Streptomyces sp. ISL-12 TaxID=2819177 RepID=UPI001BEBA793|nr:hypothetical protein [Streptomyces sp. ISL-12]MBT2412750.1 hypothetical protein [Streptomyces sp. ISL-12]
MAGSLVGLLLGVLVGMTKSVWLHFTLPRLYLTVRHRLPFALMSFLRDAHKQRGILRQVGSVYQFRHIDLQRHLAAQYGRSTSGS